MNILDISILLRPGMPAYPGDPAFEKTAAKSRAAGDLCEVSRLVLGSHGGTHVDVPFHFVPGGTDLTAAALAPFIGPCLVLEAKDTREVGSAALAAIPPGTRRVLFKTDNSARWNEPAFAEDYTYLAAEAARDLVARGVTLVGWDYLSIEAFHATEPVTHGILLGAGVFILEGVNLNSVAPGSYFLSALPLAIAGGDGSPVRAVLLEGVHAPEAP